MVLTLLGSGIILLFFSFFVFSLEGTVDWLILAALVLGLGVIVGIIDWLRLFWRSRAKDKER